MSELAATNGAVNIRGEITFATARKLYDAMQKLAAREPFTGSMRVDLAAVTKTDSAGLALLIHWSNRATVAAVPIMFTNPPPQLRRMIKIAGLEALLSPPTKPDLA